MNKPQLPRSPRANPLPQTPTTPPPIPAAEAELTWFFNQAEVAVSQPTNFQALLAGASPTSLEAVERRAEAMHAAHKIQNHLSRLDPTEALLLAGFYTERPWSRAVTRALPGGLAGAARVSPQLLSAYVCALKRGETRAQNVTDFVEELARTAPAAVLTSWRAKLKAACTTALRAYERVRRDGPSVALPEEDR
jgi:hypothetical protein